MDKEINKIYPIDFDKNELPELLNFSFKVLSRKFNTINCRLGNDNVDMLSKSTIDSCIEKYSMLSEQGEPIENVITSIISDLLVGVPFWRNPNMFHNVGAPSNIISSLFFAISSELNIFNINDGLAGNSIAAETAVANILIKIAKIESKHPHGLFTFGGTGTNLYAMKVGTRKAEPFSRSTGLSKKVKFIITEDAHFSHVINSDWLGVGANSVLEIKANNDRRSDVGDFEKKMRSVLEAGNSIGCIVLNGGSIYDHSIDDIPSFINIRNSLVKEFNLSYSPHIHIDSVIGWAWLMFADYNFDTNPLDIPEISLKMIQNQYNRIQHIKLADSWGCDFHKAIGSCPVNSSIIIMNDRNDFELLSKSKKITDIDQVADTFSYLNPVDYTLETSRPIAPALAALSTLKLLGKDGFRRHIVTLVNNTILLRELIKNSCNDVVVLNEHSLGFVTMIRVYPPDIEKIDIKNFELYSTDRDTSFIIKKTNEFMYSFFEWENINRLNKGIGVVYSFSKKYIKCKCGEKISALKWYLVSPHLDKSIINQAFDMLIKRKEEFIKTVWNKK